METNKQQIMLQSVIESCNDDFDPDQRAAIFEALKNSNPTDDALLGAKMMLEKNNWDYKVVQEVFRNTALKIDLIARKNRKQKHFPLKYAAVFMPILLVSGYYFMTTTRATVATYYTTAAGLPHTMCVEKESTWDDLMTPYVAKEYKKAFVIAAKILSEKPLNDTAVYYHAVLAYELKEYALSKSNFNTVAGLKGSNYNKESEFRLGFVFDKLNQNSQSKAQFAKVAADVDNPFNEEASIILNTVFK